MNKIEYFKYIIESFFSTLSDQSRDENLDDLLREISLSNVNAGEFQEAYDLILLDENFNWREFSILNDFHYDVPEFTNEMARHYFKYCFHDAAYPEHTFTLAMREELVVAVFNVLKAEKKELSFQKIYDKLKETKEYQDLDFFNLLHVFGDGRGIFERRIVLEEGEYLKKINILEDYRLGRDMFLDREPNTQQLDYIE